MPAVTAGKESELMTKRNVICGLAICACGSFLAPRVAAQQAPPSETAMQAAAAKPTPRTPDGHPDFNGYWETGTRRGFVGADGVTYSSFFPKPGDAPRPAAARPAPNDPPYKPELVAKVKELGEHAEAKDTKDPAFFCKPLGVPRAGHPTEIVQSPNLMVFLYQVDAGEGTAPGIGVRLIPTDGRPHRTDVDPMYFGDSVAHWEGDTLVVDVTHLIEDTWMNGKGAIHSGQLHVVERITRVGDTLRWEATAEDPKVLTKPWALTPQVAMLTKDMVVEQPPCEEKDLASGNYGDSTPAKQ
jgi:hypothetical protein